jgi:hypothetical protein
MLLEEPTVKQLDTLELIARAVPSEQPYGWPVFDYLEADLDDRGLDAWIVLETLPRHPRTRYAAAHWSRAPNVRPTPEVRVGLTVLGFHHLERAKRVNARMVETFLLLLSTLAERRRLAPRSPHVPRKPAIASHEALAAVTRRGIPGDLLTQWLLWELLEHEPPTWGAGGSIDEDGTWTRDIPREVYLFDGVDTFDAYVERMLAMFPEPAAAISPSPPSPLELVAAIDYLDTVWRLAIGRGDHLFEHHSAVRTAQLAAGVATAAEFESRLSALSELLHSVQLPPKAPSGRRPRDRPLAHLESYVLSVLPESKARIERAIATLHSVIDVRDAGQHTKAGDRGATALADLGIGYPPASWPQAWDVVSARTIEALDGLREEIATLTP